MKIFGYICLLLILFVLNIYGIMWVWNALIPVIFAGASEITFWQAFGLWFLALLILPTKVVRKNN